jgi:hypothetical protein
VVFDENICSYKQTQTIATETRKHLHGPSLSAHGIVCLAGCGARHRARFGQGFASYLSRIVQDDYSRTIYIHNDYKGLSIIRKWQLRLRTLLYLLMPGVPKSRGCEACRKQRKKVGPSRYRTTRVSSKLDLLLLIGDHSAINYSHLVQGVPDCSYHVLERAFDATSSWIILVPKARQSSRNSSFPVVALSKPFHNLSMVYRQTVASP